MVAISDCTVYRCFNSVAELDLLAEIYRDYDGFWLVKIFKITYIYLVHLRRLKNRLAGRTGAASRPVAGFRFLNSFSALYVSIPETKSRVIFLNTKKKRVASYLA